MRHVPSSLTRRALVAAAGAAALAPAAHAAPAPGFPLRIVYARIDPNGFAYIRSDEQSHWTAFQSRLGGLVSMLSPIQPESLIGATPPDVDGGASCAMVARLLAADRGYGHVILYATHDGRPGNASSGDWLSKAFAGLRSAYGGYGRAAGEAHLLDVGGGPPLISAMADAPPRKALNLFDNRRNPERETLARLTRDLEASLQTLARPAYEAQRSIAG